MFSCAKYENLANVLTKGTVTTLLQVKFCNLKHEYSCKRESSLRWVSFYRLNIFILLFALVVARQHTCEKIYTVSIVHVELYIMHKINQLLQTKKICGLIEKKF